MRRRPFLSGDTGHTVLIDLPADLPRAMADRERIVQVLNNLLANAARHSPETAPIRVSAARHDMHVGCGKRSRSRRLSGQESAPSFVSRSARRLFQIGGKSPFICLFRS